MKRAPLSFITTRNLRHTTLQELFDQVAWHLLTQNKQSVKSGCCMYRGPDGLQCAAGPLIDDQDYKPILEGATWNTASSILREGDKAARIRDLQSIHDSRPHTQEWPAALRELAKIRNLSPEILEEFA